VKTSIETKGGKSNSEDVTRKHLSSPAKTTREPVTADERQELAGGLASLLHVPALSATFDAAEKGRGRLAEHIAIATRVPAECIDGSMHQ